MENEKKILKVRIISVDIVNNSIDVDGYYFNLEDTPIYETISIEVEDFKKFLKSRTSYDRDIKGYILKILDDKAKEVEKINKKIQEVFYKIFKNTQTYFLEYIEFERNKEIEAIEAEVEREAEAVGKLF